MKKNLRIILLVLVVEFLTTGCMEENISMVVNNDKSMDFSMYISLDLKAMQDLENSFGGTNNEMTDEEYLNCIDENDGDETNCIAPGSSSSSDFDIDDIKDSINQDAVKEWEEEGFTVTQNITSDKLELNLSKKFDNIDDVSSNEDVEFNIQENSDKFFKMEKGFLEDKYTFHMVMNNQDSDTSSNSSFNIDTGSFGTSALSSMIDATYKLTLPNESITNNATSVSDDKKTLTWDLIANGSNDILVTFALPNANKNLIMYGGIGLGVVIILIILIIVISKSKKKKAKSTSNQTLNISQEYQNIMSSQSIVNQNTDNEVMPSMNNEVNPMTMVSPTVNSVPQEPVVNQNTDNQVMPSMSNEVNPMTMVNPSVNSVPQEQVVNQNIGDQVMPSINNEANPMTMVTSTVNSVPQEPVVNQVSSNDLGTLANDNKANKINADLQNMALNILNQNDNNE